MKLFVNKSEPPRNRERRVVNKFLIVPRVFNRDFRVFEFAEIVEMYSSIDKRWREVDFLDNRTKYLEDAEGTANKALGIDIKEVKKSHILDDDDRRHSENYEPVGKNIYEIFDVFLEYYKKVRSWEPHKLNQLKSKLCREIRILGYPVYERDIYVEYNEATKRLEVSGANRYVSFILEMAKKAADQEAENIAK